MAPALITLTSDFGPGPYPGIMKGVILGICPGAALVDLSHAVAPQAVRAGALVLEQALAVFPPGTVHLAVVDPGVGTGRRPLCLAGLGMFFVGPDNGLFTPVLLADPRARAYELAEPRYFRHPVSDTFHGRDIFAPVAAHLARGLEPARLGPAVEDPVRLDWPRPRRQGDSLRGMVWTVDHFGNLGTNLGRELVEDFLAGRPARVETSGLVIEGISRAYGQAAPGEPLALYDSGGRLELALNQGDLCARLGLERERVYGREVVVTPQPR